MVSRTYGSCLWNATPFGHLTKVPSDSSPDLGTLHPSFPIIPTQTKVVTLRRTDSSDQDFINLVDRLNADLKARDGEDNAFYSQFSKLDLIKEAVVAYQNGRPVGCGAIRAFSPDATEVKRMYVVAENRGQGIAANMLAELEAWAKELGYRKCVLETGKRQPEAIGLYKKWGYAVIENYGPYAGVENSVCFEKWL